MIINETMAMKLIRKQSSNALKVYEKANVLCSVKAALNKTHINVS